MGLPRSPSNALWMLAFLTPPEVSRSFMGSFLSVSSLDRCVG
jgi:hypothetical protein